MGNYVKDALYYLIPGMVVILAYIVGSLLVLNKQNRKVSRLWFISSIILGVYLIVIFAVTISPVYGFQLHPDVIAINLIPGKALGDMGQNPLNFFGNILMFMPLGFLLPLISNRMQRLFPVTLLGFMMSFMIEFLQLFLERGTDIDDLILNTIGTVLGFAVSVIAFRRISGLFRSAGVYQIKNERTHRVRRDQMGPVLLATLMMVTVIGLGFVQRQELLASDVQPETDAQMLKTNIIENMQEFLQLNTEYASITCIEDNELIYSKGEDVLQMVNVL